MEFPFETISKTQAGDKVFVLRQVQIPVESPVRNLLAYSQAGELLWTAENPIGGTGSFFNQVMSIDPLQVYNYAGFLCTFDSETGSILNSEFTK